MLELDDERLHTLLGPSGSEVRALLLYTACNLYVSPRKHWQRLHRWIFFEEQLRRPGAYAIIVYLAQRCLGQTTPSELVRLAIRVEIARLGEDRPQPPGWILAEYQRTFNALSLGSVYAAGTPPYPDFFRLWVALLCLQSGFPIYAIAIFEFSAEELGDFFLEEHISSGRVE